MRFILRQVVLAHRWRAQLDDVIELSRRVGIDEVMMMEQSHQIVTVPFPVAKHAEMAAIYHEYARALRANGVDVSVNVATVVGHSDAPVADDQVLPFTTFVGEDLQACRAVYCYSDPGWVRYVAEVVALYAAVGPKRLMIDDDFRSLNHSTPTGCFCPTHATLTARALGRDAMTPVELRDALVTDSAWGRAVKSAWQSVNFGLQLDAARAIEAAVHAVDPAVEVGLMNSGEPAHSLQGRDMVQLLEAFAGSGRPTLSRPAGGAYADALHEDVVAMHQMPALSYHAAGGRGVWVSEVENWPHSRFIKSVAITRLQMLLHALWGADALTLNIYDYLATPMRLEPAWEELLVSVRPDLARVQAARSGKVLAGVAIPWRHDAATHQRNRSGGIGGLHHRRPLDTLLPLLGIPVQFEIGDVNVVLGDDVLAYSDDELRLLLGRGLLVDNVAAEWLGERGWGDALGGHLDGRIVVPCVERLTHPGFSGEYLGCDLATNWFRLAERGQWISCWSPEPGAVVVSSLVDDRDQAVGAAVSVFENSFGGRVAVLAQPVQELGWLHRGRAAQMQAVVSWLAGSQRAWPLVAEGPNVAPFVYVDPSTGQRLLALVNTGLDPVAVDLERLGVDEAFDGGAAPPAVTLEPLQIWFGSTRRP